MLAGLIRKSAIFLWVLKPLPTIRQYVFLRIDLRVDEGRPGPGIRYSAMRLAKSRHHLLAEQAQRVHHTFMGDQAAAVDLGEYAVEAEFVL